MQPTKSVEQIITEIDESVMTYYDYSFRIDNERCMVIIQKLISQIEQLFFYLNRDMQQKLEKLLVKSLEAMDRKDYVLLRDILYYDLRQFSTSVMRKK